MRRFFCREVCARVALDNTHQPPWWKRLNLCAHAYVAYASFCRQASKLRAQLMCARVRSIGQHAFGVMVPTRRIPMCIRALHTTMRSAERCFFKSQQLRIRVRCMGQCRNPPLKCRRRHLRSNGALRFALLVISTALERRCVLLLVKRR